MLLSIQSSLSEAVRTASNGKTDVLPLDAPPMDKADIAVPMGAFSKKNDVPIGDASRTIADALGVLPFFSSVNIVGPFVNVRIRDDVLFRAAAEGIANRNIATKNPQRIMVEYLSPNTNKPLHLGHVRNGVLGSTLANLLEAAGHTVVRADLINDRGEHICKSMLAYSKFFNGATPESLGKKGDHFVGDCYVRYAQAEAEDPSIKEEVEQMLLQWEAGDSEVRNLWQTMNKWVYDGFDVTLDRYGFRFDKVYRESELYTLGKDQVQLGLDRGILVRDETGAVRFPLPDYLGKGAGGEQRKPKVLNANGTSVYLTQDIGTAIVKAEEFNLDRSIYVVANEQDYHFIVLFEILKAFGYQWAQNCHHLSYAMVELKGGKMKSRTGQVVDADDLADDMATLASVIIRERSADLDEAEIARRAEVIGMAAIKFYLLRYNTMKVVNFDPSSSISFDGDTAPFCLYAYARARSVIEKAALRGIMPAGHSAHTRLGSSVERALALELIRFPFNVRKAADTYSPSVLVESLLEVAKAFNRFYKIEQVLCEDESLTRERLQLVKSAAEAMRWGFSLMNIVPLEKM